MVFTARKTKQTRRDRCFERGTDFFMTPSRSQMKKSALEIVLYLLEIRPYPINTHAHEIPFSTFSLAPPLKYVKRICSVEESKYWFPKSVGVEKEIERITCPIHYGKCVQLGIGQRIGIARVSTCKEKWEWQSVIECVQNTWCLVQNARKHWFFAVLFKGGDSLRR